MPRLAACACPTRGYAYWGAQYDYGVHDMLSYCEHCAAGEWDPWSRGCCDKGEKVTCHLQPTPNVTRGPANNTLAIEYCAATSTLSAWPRLLLPAVRIALSLLFIFISASLLIWPTWRSPTHYFGPSLTHALALYHPTHAVWYVLLSAQAYRMLIKACYPMLCQNWGFRA